MCVCEAHKQGERVFNEDGVPVGGPSPQADSIRVWEGGQKGQSVAGWLYEGVGHFRH